MELYRLRAFAAVAEESHLTRAAHRLNMSQPAVSGQIKALEQEFDLRLFERGAGGMKLTAAGRELLVHARQVLAATDELRCAARRLKSDVAGVLRVGTVSDPTAIRVGALLARAVERYPNLELELHNEISGAALECVHDGRLDASFYFGHAPPPDIKALRLTQYSYCVAAPAAWCDRLRDASWSDIAALAWVMTPAISTHHRLVLDLFEQKGIAPPQGHVEADQESVIEDLVRSGVGISLMREEAARARQQAGEVCLWEAGQLRTTLWFICSSARAEDPLLRAVFDLVGETWQSERAALPRGDDAQDETALETAR